MNRLKKILVSLARNLFKNDDGNSITEETSILEVVEVIPDEPSSEICKEQDVSDEKKEKDLARLEKLLREALFSEREEEKSAPTTYILNNEDEQWYYAPNSRSMIRIPARAELVVSDPTPNDDGKVLCYCDFGFIMVPAEEISPLGYN
mgnify:CR=1 FL=1